VWPQTARQLLLQCSTGPQQNVDDDYCACWVKAVGGRVFLFFLNRGPSRSKSGHVRNMLISVGGPL